MPCDERRSVAADIVHDGDGSCNVMVSSERFVFRCVAKEGEENVGYLHAKRDEQRGEDVGEFSSPSCRADHGAEIDMASNA